MCVKKINSKNILQIDFYYDFCCSLVCCCNFVNLMIQFLINKNFLIKSICSKLYEIG